MDHPTKTLTPPLTCYGGKSYLAKRIITLFPPHLHYVEAYFGGGSVLLAKDPEGISEVVNDIDGNLINFWKCLQDRHAFRQLYFALQLTPFAQEEFLQAAVDLAPPYVSNIARARAFFIRCRQSRLGIGKDFATLTRTRTRCQMNEQVAAYLGAIEGMPAIAERLRHVVILKKEALDVIASQDGPETLFYLDPPYPTTTRTTTNVYRYEMTDHQHGDLCRLLKTIEGYAVLSSYPTSLYDSILLYWNHLDIEIDNKASTSKTKPKMIERLYYNFATPKEA